MRTILFCLALLGAVVGRGQIVLDWYTQPMVISADTCGAFVSAGVYKKFLCHNLGANTAVVPTTPSWELIGNYYQWGRNPTCFGFDGIDAANPCSAPVYGAAAPFGSTAATDNAGAITGWSTVAAPAGAWGAVKTADDPCPSGWRVPTLAELSGVIDASLNTRTIIGSFSSSATNYSSGVLFGTSLFLPTGGRRASSTGSLEFRGGFGIYWASGSGSNILFSNTAFITQSSANTTGMSVRCIEE